MADTFVPKLAGIAARTRAILIVGWLLWSHTLFAQSELAEAVAVAQEAWLGHRVADLLSGSDTVRLHIPGIAPSASLRPSQAAKLLEQYLRMDEERDFSLRDIEEIAAGHAYAEFRRAYVVKGTAEQREETVFLGFRRIAETWRLREVRVAP